MEEPGAGTFAKLLRRLIGEGVIRTDDSVLVQFGGSFDEAVCAEVGLTNCSFSNIAPDTHSTGHTSAVKFDAHRMPQPPQSYDHVMGHSGLHHCSRPHEALHEMYRLARKTVIFVENQDSLMMRAATRAGIVTWHELVAVIDGEYKSGGVDGTGVPNFIYRWTRREVRKVSRHSTLPTTSRSSFTGSGTSAQAGSLVDSSSASCASRMSRRKKASAWLIEFSTPRSPGKAISLRRSSEKTSRNSIPGWNHRRR